MPPRPSIDRETHKRAIAAALRDLERALDLLLQSLLHDPVLVSVEGTASERDALRLAGEACTAIRYAPEQAANETTTCLGVIGAPAALLARAEDVNLAKTALKAACAPLQNQRVRVPTRDGQGGRIVQSVPLVRVLLRELQASDLNLLAAYRRLPILTGRPARIAYVRARTRAVYRKSREEILALLERSDRPGAEADRTRVLRLPDTERHLALVEERYENIRANVTFNGLDARNRGRAQLAAELPLFYPLGRARELPAIHYPDAATDTAIQPRAGKLELEPYLATLPVHRYRTLARRRPTPHAPRR